MGRWWYNGQHGCRRMSGSRSLFWILLTRIARLFFASGQGVFLPVWPSGGGCHAHGSADQAPPRLRFRHLRERGSRGKDPLQSSSILFNPLQSFAILCNPFQSPLLRSSMDPAPIPDLDPCRGRPILIRIDLFNPLQSSSILFNRPSFDPAWIPPRFGSLSGSADPDQDRRAGAVPVSGPDQDRLGEDVRGDPRAPILIRIVGGQAGDPVFDPDQETAVPIPSDGGS